MRAGLQIVAASVLMISASGAALGQTSSRAEDGVRAADAAWLKVYAGKELEKTVAFCNEQTSVLPSNAPIANGKKAIAKLSAEAFATQDLTWHVDRAGVARSGELGFTSGTYDMTFKDASGETVTDKG
jgi:ketosteroid isomerase-like protein